MNDVRDWEGVGILKNFWREAPFWCLLETSFVIDITLSIMSRSGHNVE